MGSAQSKVSSGRAPAPVPASAGVCPVKHDAAPSATGPIAAFPGGGAAGSCPVKHDAPSPGLPATCPVSHKGSEKRDRGVVYNVYAEPIDPKNMMPASANQTVNVVVQYCGRALASP